MATMIPIRIKNVSGHNALVQLYHILSNGHEVHGGGWIISKNATQDAFSVSVSDTTVFNMWKVRITTLDGDRTVNDSDGSLNLNWEKGKVSNGDAAGVTFTVSTSQFVMPLSTGTVTVPVKKTENANHITNIFVLMLENHSFDNVFAMSGIKGIKAATTSNSNTYNNKPYAVAKPAPYSMSNDPGHEFLDVYQQLTGKLPSTWNEGQSYPTSLNNSGFVANFANSNDGDVGKPDPSTYQNVMKCFDTPTQLPVILKLAQEFAICDHWFSSMPGPTWPNRFFAHAASSANMDDSPNSAEAAEMQTTDGMSFANDTIFDLIKNAGLRYRLYNDNDNDYADQNAGDSTRLGSFAIVSAIEGITSFQVNPLRDFENDLNMPYPFVYTFIEPNYGDVDGGTFKNGSSQHPMDGMGGGEALIKAVYETIRKSPIWYTSLLIVTYDEHGGFYDSVQPPSAHPPGDTYLINWYNMHGFKFDRNGPRVPAVVISPSIPKGKVDTTVYDHSAIPRTIESRFGLKNLTNRDKNAHSVEHLLSLSFTADGLRTDCPLTLPDPVRPAVASPAPTAEEKEAMRQQPLPEKGNVIGFLKILAKTEFDLSAKTDEDRARITENYKQIKTYGDLQDYTLKIVKLREQFTENS